MDFISFLLRLFVVILLLLFFFRKAPKKERARPVKRGLKKAPPSFVPPQKPVEKEKLEEVKPPQEKIPIDVIEITEQPPLFEEVKKLSKKKLILGHIIIGRPKGLEKRRSLPLNDLPGEPY